MKLQNRNLVFGMQGNDVRELQRALVWLGFDTLPQEISSGRFGETTRAAVQLLQKQNRLEPDGAVDIKTVEAMNEKLRGLKRMVRGNVLKPDGQRLARTNVQAFDKELRNETKLGEATCDAAGYFEIRYVFGAPDRVAPNLVVKGFATASDAQPVAVSAVVFEANPEVIINLVAGKTEHRGLSEFELLMRDIKPVVEGQRIKMVELVEDEKTQDVIFLSRQTRHTADRVVHAVLSHRHAEKSRLEPEVFYAWLRQGLPTEPSALLSQDPSILRHALVQAVSDNVIPRGFETEAKLNATLESLKAWRASVALEDPPDPKQMTLGKLVKSVLGEEPQQQRFMRAYAEHSGPIEDFWKKLEQDAQLAPRAAELKFAVLLGNLGQNHLPLVNAVRSTAGLKDLKDLASLNEDAWHVLITNQRVGTPADIEGANEEEKARRYARSLANAVEAALPTEFFVARLKETDVVGKADLLKFFESNPAFNIKQTRLETFLKANPTALGGVSDQAATKQQLKSLLRVYRLAPRFKAALGLQQAGETSARSISRLGQNAFVTRHERHFDSPEEAKAVYAKARQVSASAIALIADVSPAMNRVPMYAVPDSVASVVAEIPQWSALFGSLDFCSCEQCQSVHSPAAYLVDLLNFLKNREANSAEPTPSVKDILFARRPDLGEIELSCENTNTVMPYVDLVLEVLEDAVAPSPDFSPFELDSNRIPDLDQGRLSLDLRAAFADNLSAHARIRVKRPGEWWVVDDVTFSYSVRKQTNGKPSVETRGRQTGGTQQECAANPQYVNPQAYTTLKEARFPWSLPFDQSLEEARAYVGHLGVPRHQIMEAFLPGERSTVLGNPALAAEYLGLSSKEVELISEANPATLWLQWGFEPGIQTDAALVKIKTVDEFLRRSGLEYRELLDLLQVRYVNPGNSLAIVSTDAHHPDTCDTSRLTLHELDAGFASRIVRFVRLWRTLGWTMFELDRAISALGGDLTTGFLVQSSHLKRLRASLNLSVEQVLAFWTNIDTGGDDALYQRLFQNPAVLKPVDVAFKLNGEELDVTAASAEAKISKHTQTILAALRISAADLAALTATEVIDDALNLANLTKLYRISILAKGLRLSITDTLTLKALTSIDPFDVAHTEDTLIFVERVTQTKDAGLSFADLDYLLRHQSEASTKMAIKDPAVADRLQDIWRDAQEGPTNKIIERKLEKLFGLEENTVPSLEPQWTSLTESVLADVGKEIKRAIFPIQFEALGRLSVAANGTALSDEAIAILLLDIRQALQKAIAAKEVIARKLAEAFGFEVRTVKLLEPQWISIAERPLADVPKELITRSNFGIQFNDIVRLHKISKIATHFHLDAGMLEWLLGHGAAQGLFDLTSFSNAPSATNFSKWNRLVNLFALRDVMRQGEAGLLELLEFIHQTVAPDKAQVLAKLAELVNWNQADLQYLVGANGFGPTFADDLKNEEALLQLRDCFALLKRLGISAEQAMKLSEADVTPAAAQGIKQAVRAKYDDAQWLSIAKPLRDVLRERQRAALVAFLVTHLKLPFTQRETPHPDLLLNVDRPAVRELQQKLNATGADPALAIDGVFGPETRDAVIVFQNANGLPADGEVRAATWAELDLARRNLRNTNDLYGHFLIDVEMDPCMMTSRIKQAISSVQLFVQRCLMNLEGEVQASSQIDDAWDWWKWMKNYRIWEANLKVFLYPENWIEPELRDDKSPFFKELESELLESDLTLDTAEKAFLNYVEKLDQVARLEMMGTCHQKDGEADVLHVFARTQAPPRVYYYRQRVNAAYWTPWEKVDLDIEGDHLIPVLWNSRLFLFWPMFMEKASPLNVKIPPLAIGGAINDETKKYWDMKLAWSERKQGRWTGKKISSQSAKISKRGGQLADLSNIFFAPMVQNSDLVIYQLYDTTGTGQKPGISLRMIDDTDPSHIATELDPQLPPHPPHVDDPDPPDNDVPSSQNRFYFGGCYFDPQITSFDSGSIGSGQKTLVGTMRSYMFFQENVEAGLNLPVRRDIDNSQAALAQTPGQYRVTSQGADPRVAQNPFFFQDSARSYLIVPKLSWQDDFYIDPSEVGGAIAERRVSTFTSPAVTALAGAASTLAPEFVRDTGLAVSPAIALGPDTHGAAPFILRPSTKYSFHTLYHPYVCALIYILNRQGLDQMLRREVQLEPHRFLPGGVFTTPFSFQAVYGPSTEMVAQPYPMEELDFSFSGAYSSYNWELFFHAPLLIADRLTKNQRFEEAAKWFHYVFNPTDTSSKPAPQRYWQTKEFFEKTSEAYQQERLGNLFKLLVRADELRRNPNPTSEEQKDLQRLNDLEAAIKAWRDHPFKPHLVARTRTTAYQKAVVMKYIDNLIAWGDQLFRRDTLETINEATQLYVLAADILGARPVEVPPRLTPRVQTYNSLEGRLDDFSNALVEVEEFVPVDPDPNVSDPEQQPPTMLYFCLPKNDKLLRFWDTVADRLFKIRHCMNIEGVVRQLPLFEPPIDPALLVRGAAAGLDLNSLLNDVDKPLPGYRFSILAQKATELCGELRSLGATLLATLEKRDAEELSLLRAKHETGMLEMIEQVREKQVAEATEQLNALSASRDVIIGRLGHYQRLLGEDNPKPPAVGERVQERDRPRFSEIQSLAGVKMFPHEVLENTLLGVAQGFETLAATQEFFGAVLHAIPDANLMFMGMGVTVSGLGNIPQAGAAGNRGLASVAHFGASTTARLGSYIARELDWVLQHNQAAREIMQIDKQIIAAEIRREIASHELRNHSRQIENATEVEEFMRDKYTNQELYSWMVGQMSGVYFQAYQLAYETAKRTEQCFRHELGIEGPSFIQFGYWPNLKKGLLAGEKLHHDLKRLEIAYLDQNKRELELIKHISLVLLNPLALVKLRETGQCSFRLPEEIFDLDYPGHYFRRIKSVSLTLPCVTGPYTTISCTLRLLRNSIRINTNGADNADNYPRHIDSGGLPSDDSRFVENNIPVKAIAASNAQNDSGVFELSFRDERYLPFEGAGAVSEWSLELFNDNNADFGKPLRQFDYSTISDAILHVKYTAREDAGVFKNGAIAHLRDYFSQSTNSLVMLNLRQQFPSQWQRFLHPISAVNENAFDFDMSASLFPIRDVGKTLKVNMIMLLARCTDAGTYQVQFTPEAPGAASALALNRVNEYGGLHFAARDTSGDSIEVGETTTKWSLKMTPPPPGTGNVQENEVEDVLLVLGYQWEL